MAQSIVRKDEQKASHPFGEEALVFIQFYISSAGLVFSNVLMSSARLETSHLKNTSCVF